MADLKITPLRISTMTTTCQMGTTIRLDTLFQKINIIPYWYLGEGVLKMEYKGETKGVSRNDIMLRRKRVKKTFFNQSSLVVRLLIGTDTWKEVNIKLFSNGGVQMTGVPDDRTGRNAIEWLASHVETTYPEVFPTKRGIHRYETQLVNSDYSIGVPIRREKLHKILVETYGLFSTFESTIYQGVNTKFYYNKALAAAKSPPGICLCPTPCEGTGNGEQIGDCKRITISPFQTGRIIITGARSLEQIEEAYRYMNEIFRKHAAEIIRVSVVKPEASVAAVAPVTTPAKNKHLWVPHPSPRNIIQIPAEKVIETLPE